MRGVTNGWMSIWDLAKPVIAQVHGYCLAGGSELATGCDLVYVAEDAKIGYPAVRFGTPDMQYHAWLFGMRGGHGVDAHRRLVLGGRGRAARLGQPRLSRRGARGERAGDRERIAQIPSDLVQINKRTVHRAMEVMGLRSSIRAGTELSALATHTETMKKFVADIQASGLTDTLTKRDTPFGDYRTARRTTTREHREDLACST